MNFFRYFAFDNAKMPTKEMQIYATLENIGESLVYPLMQSKH